MQLSLKRVELPSEEILLDSSNDTFYETHRSQSFGVVADALQKRTQIYRNRHAETIEESKEITNLSHLRDRLDRVPELNAIGRNISKHLKILSELNRLVEERTFFESTRVAQRLAVRGPVSESDCVKSLLELFSRKPSVPREDCVRLVLMFALRYEGSESSLKRLIRAVPSSLLHSSDDLEDLIDRMIRRMGSRKRTGDLFSNKTYGAVLGGTFDLFKSMTAGTITQIEPLLRTVLIDGLLKDKLEESEYPTYCENISKQDFKRKEIKTKKKNVVVFMIGGGVTYAEARVVDLINREMEKKKKGVRVVLGGSNVLSSGDFVELIRGSRDDGDRAWFA
jgi:vacuolar protein sorting-associated protein 45